MNLLIRVLLASIGCLVSASLLAGELAGYWKNDGQPAQLNQPVALPA